MSSCATAVYYLDILSRNHQILQESRAGVSGIKTQCEDCRELNSDKSVPQFFHRYRYTHLERAAFSTFFLKKEVVLRENVICNQRFNVKIEES